MGVLQIKWTLITESGRRSVQILIAGRQAVTRQAMKRLLQTRNELDVVGEAADAGKLMTQVEALCPDLVLLDVDLPGGSMGDLISTLRRLDARPAVIVLSAWPEAEGAALSAGADAFVFKGDPPKSLLIAVEAIRLRSDYE